MPITVCEDHSSKSLIELYEELENYENPVWSSKSKLMIELINLINQTFVDTQIWGLTSHDRLVLLNENMWNSRWHVIIESYGYKDYCFEYAIPESKSPWENGMVRGFATIAEARRYLIIAMNESEGWKGNEELEALLKTI